MRINEIFYSLQGEGRNAGRAGVFVRFSGCNLKCPFCDTDFKDYTEMSEPEVVEAIKRADEGGSGFVILTGGEPTMQITDSFLALLHKAGYEVAVETNGCYTDAAAFAFDWITLSPKGPFFGKNGLTSETLEADEVKLVVDMDNVDEDIIRNYHEKIEADYYYLQPCDTGNHDLNAKIIDKTICLIKNNPEWQLSLQQQKILGVR